MAHVRCITIVFHCPQIAALSQLFLSYIVPFHWIASLVVVVRQLWLGPFYLEAISYGLGIITLVRLEGVLCAGNGK